MYLIKIVEGKVVKSILGDSSFLNDIVDTSPGLWVESIINYAIGHNYENGQFRDPTYAELRKKEYPPITDYLDAIVKEDLEEVQKYKDSCMAIKTKYPKPIKK